MNVKRIVVDELPESCGKCNFSIETTSHWSCFVLGKKLFTPYSGILGECPLEVEEVCEWVREKTDRGYAAFYIPKDHDQHDDCYTQDAGTFEFCPSCGKSIKYVESEE